MRTQSLFAEADNCRFLARSLVDRPEHRLALQLAAEFEGLAAKSPLLMQASTTA